MTAAALPRPQRLPAAGGISRFAADHLYLLLAASATSKPAVCL